MANTLGCVGHVEGRSDAPQTHLHHVLHAQQLPRHDHRPNHGPPAQPRREAHKHGEAQHVKVVVRHVVRRQLQLVGHGVTQQHAAELGVDAVGQVHGGL